MEGMGECHVGSVTPKAARGGPRGGGRCQFDKLHRHCPFAAGTKGTAGTNGP